MTGLATARLRRLLGRARDKALLPVTARLGVLEDSTAGRLDELTRRVASMEAVLQMLDGRAATVSERTVSVEESQIRLSRRLAEIEALLESAGRSAAATEAAAPEAEAPTA